MTALIRECSNDYSDASDDEAEWSLSKWWNSSCNKGCYKAEKGLVKHFIDTDIYEFKSQQVLIDYDPEPISVKQKRLSRSQSFSLFSHAPDKTELIQTKRQSDASKSTGLIKQENTTKKQQSKCRSKCVNDKNEIIDKQEIHTLTFRIKADKLQDLVQKASQNYQQSKYAQPEQPMEYAPPEAIDDEIKNDGQAIEGKSLSRFFVRQSGQAGSSDISKLQHSITKHTKIKLSQQNNNDATSCSQDKIVPIVLSHGYGCAGGIFIPSMSTIFETLLSRLNLQESPIVHVLDWLGGGMSSRPQFQCETTEEAEDWFVESLEAWRKAMNIDKMVLAAHSMGGYAVAVYAMRYPQYIDHLILLSPCGVPVRPPDAFKQLENYSWKVRTMFKTFGKFWSAGWTPHDLIRMSGPKGKQICQRIVQKRLFRLSDDDPLKELLAEYLYHVIAQPGSGEYAMHKILAPGAYAFNPLAPRLAKLKKYQQQVIGYDDYHNVNDNDNDNDIEEEEVEQKGGNESESDVLDVDKTLSELNKNLKIDFIYGTTDWMTSAHAVKLKMDKSIKCDVYITPDCGHQLILENAQGFGQLLGAVIAKGQILSQ